MAKPANPRCKTTNHLLFIQGNFAYNASFHPNANGATPIAATTTAATIMVPTDQDVIIRKSEMKKTRENAANAMSATGFVGNAKFIVLCTPPIWV